MFRLVLRALLSFLAVSACAADEGVTTTPKANPPPSNGFQLNLTTPEQYTVIPLPLNQQGPGINFGRGLPIDGDMIAANISNYNKIARSNVVAYLSCDNGDSYITADKMLNYLIESNPMAIVLYSLDSNWCSLDNTETLTYGNILSMADAADAEQVLRYLNGTGGGRAVHVEISGNTTSNDNGPPSSGSGSNSKVAMSVLYSITGLISLLFLIIIITGAVRAHRYPERYGPLRALGGRPRQSRAKGLARAVLDTIPIVKFSNQQPVKPDPELELETATTDGGRDAAVQGPVPNEAGDAQQGQQQYHKKGPAHVISSRETSDDVQPDPASEAKSAQETTDNGSGNLGCSICTEDFKVGEDMRVLPCNHQFHPNCIDPWLINVSGTCPLCRLDLRPEAPEGEQSELNQESTSPLPPPLTLEVEDVGGNAASHRHRLSRFFDVNRLRQATAEEQMEALRQMRTSEADPEGQEPDGEERGQRARLTAKLKDRFRIRTRARSPDRRDG